MLIALSGTPGVGKTTISSLLQNEGYKVLSLEKMAEEGGFVEGFDEEMGSKEIDLEGLDKYIHKQDYQEDVIIEGHLSHLLSVDLAVILRCDPLVLKERLKEKGWKENKIKENVGAEILDVIKVEALEEHSRVHEIDTTEKNPEEVVSLFKKVLEGDYEDPKISWLEKYEHLLF